MPEHSPPPPPAAVTEQVDVERWSLGVTERVADVLAVEAPVALLYQGVPHVVLLATPADLEDLAIGFSLSEQIVRHAGEIHSVEAQTLADGAQQVRIGIASAPFSALLRRQRNLTGRTGCGLCGVEKIEDAIQPAKLVGPGIQLAVGELHDVLLALRGHQQINLKAGSVHAAAWAIPGAGIQVVREDVGRHNALDKVIGAVTRAGLDIASGYFVITSRASYEMVQKTAVAGAACLVAVSAPTALAVRIASESNVTLVGFAREDRHVVYTHSFRIVAD